MGLEERDCAFFLFLASFAISLQAVQGCIHGGQGAMALPLFSESNLENFYEK